MTDRTFIVSDEAILEAIRDGGRTERVADRLKLLSERSLIYRRLKRLERMGKVRRSERYSYVNSIYWERVE
jgi:predicted transcriptional regulator